MNLLKTPIGTRPTGQPVWLRWLLLAVFAGTLAFAFVNLGMWQLDRLDQRRERNAAVTEHESAAPLPFGDVFTKPITESDQWQRVRVRGVYDAANQFLVRYRTDSGLAGYEILTPLRSLDGSWVLIDRGFIQRPATQDYPTVLPPPPSGEVEVLGYVRRDEQGTAQATSPSGNSVRLINSVAIAAVLPYPLVNGYISLLESAPAQDGGLTPISPPSLDEGNHFSYALQWFMFALLAGIGLVVLVRADLQASRNSKGAEAA